MNYEPDEVFEYALTAVSNTKERWNRHRIFREYEINESGAVEDMCKYYKTHLKSKLPLKVFFGSQFLKDWCSNKTVLLSSEENFRQCLKGIVKAHNKKYTIIDIIPTAIAIAINIDINVILTLVNASIIYLQYYIIIFIYYTI